MLITSVGRIKAFSNGVELNAEGTVACRWHDSLIESQWCEQIKRINGATRKEILYEHTHG